MQRWRVTLLGHKERDFGDVVTADGEVIGAWSVDEFEWYSFIPDGHDQPIYQRPTLRMFCLDVADWFEGREANREHIESPEP